MDLCRYYGLYKKENNTKKWELFTNNGMIFDFMMNEEEDILPTYWKPYKNDFFKRLN